MFQELLIILVIVFGASALYLAYERYFNRGKTSHSELYINALRDLLDNRTEAAFTKLRQVVSEDTNNIDAYLRLGQILREHNKPDRSLQVHKDLTLRHDLSRDEKIAVLTHLASDYVALKEMETAEKALRELISLDHRSHWAHKTLMRVQEQQQKWEEAYESAVTLLKLESNKSKKPLARYKFQMAQQLYRKREYHKSRIVYKEAIGLDPTFVDAYLAIGDSYAQENRLEDAVNFWTKLIAAVPDKSHLVIDRLKKTLFELGRFGDLLEICQTILEHSPKNKEARRTLAEFYEKKGDLDLATEHLEGLIEDYPDDLRALTETIRLYLERNDRRKLNELLRSVERAEDKRKNTPGTTATPDTTPVRS
jgi:lipopolysaccharide biosynthesis regulator YciM